MASQRQMEANRKNAKKSTGPRSVEGKAVSSRNALKSGIDAAAETALPFENRDHLETLKNEYYERFAPSTPEQRCFVDQLINDEWLLRRFRVAEAQMLLKRADSHLAFDPDEQYPLGDAYDHCSRDLERLQRRVNATRRSYLKTLEALMQLQAAAPAEPAADPLPAQSPAVVEQLPPAEPLPQPIGFVPQLSLAPSRPPAPKPSPDAGQASRDPKTPRP